MTFTAETLLPLLPQAPRLDSLALHPTCSTVHLDITGDLRTVAEAVAGTVTVPDSWGCCAFAGDRGLLHPEVTAARRPPRPPRSTSASTTGTRRATAPARWA
ncbi:hypothetical protein ACFQ51_00955 [Streptomyces kaempferi]